jgi:hypothetical protein
MEAKAARIPFQTASLYRKPFPSYSGLKFYAKTLITPKPEVGGARWRYRRKGLDKGYHR